MKSETTVNAGASLMVRNMGGIDETAVEFAPGVNVLEGRNATNRTSLLRSIMAALGSDEVSLKGDADHGTVELTIDGETYTRSIERTQAGTKRRGEPFLDDSTLADLFAFLLESNETRQTVTRNDDLRDVIMRPVDTAEIERTIAEAKERRAGIDDRISDLESRQEQLGELQSDRSEIVETLSEKQTKLESVRQEIESLDFGVEEMQAQREVFKDRLADLNEARTELEETERRLETEKEQFEALKKERSELREERSELSMAVEDISHLGQRIGKLQERKRSLGSLLDRLQNVVQFNQEMLDETDSELRQALDPSDSDVTDQLLAEEEFICWTCGSTANRSTIDDTLDELRELRKEKMAERKDLSTELDELREQKQEMEKRQQRREQIEQRIERIDDRIDRQSQQINDLRERRETIREQADALEKEVDQIEPDGDDERTLELNKRENELVVTIESLEEERKSVENSIEEIEADLAEIPQLEDERDTVTDRLENLRTRIDDLEAGAIAAFNEHMENLIDRLGYDNLDRIWIERRETTVRNGRQKNTETVFDLHVIRTTADGAAYEDTVDHLSESEREVTGLVLALAGYLVHEVHEVVPFMLLDSLEAIDAERIASLVEYFEEYADFLVVALLPEDAQAVDDASHRVTDI